jgi:SWI/SNF related-matrix-associated actin-dependent regulator of chromatin subfamily C
MVREEEAMDTSELADAETTNITENGDKPKPRPKSTTPLVDPFENRAHQTFADTPQHYVRRPESLMEVYLNAFYITNQFEYDDISQLQEVAKVEFQEMGGDEAFYDQDFHEFLQKARISPIINPWVKHLDKTSGNYPFLSYNYVNQIKNDYEVICRWMMRNQKKHIDADTMKSLSGSYLADLALDLLAYQEKNYNQNTRSASMTRIPSKLFCDTRQSGALGYILLATLRFKRDRNIKNFKFLNPAHHDLHTELFIAIEKQLVGSEFMRRPVIYLSHDISEEKRTYLTDVIRRSQAQTTNDKKAATHIICNSESNRKFTDEARKLYVEPVWRLEDNTGQKWVLLHSLGYPDSFDKWHRATGPTWNQAPDVFNWTVFQVAGGQKFQSKKNRIDELVATPWRVTVDWILDLKEFNEWPNEKDYEVDEKRSPMSVETMKSQEIPRKMISLMTVRKMKRANQNLEETSEIIKKAKTDMDDGEDLTEGMKDPDAPGAVKVSPKSNGPNQPLRGGTLSELTGVDSLYDETLKNDEQFEENSKFQVMEQSHHIIVPSYAAWFDYNAIHSIEKRAMPEFFNGGNDSKSPEVFISYRNFMIDTYRLNPIEYLSATACRRNLAGDVCSILRCHAFLEQWGLINYQVDNDARPTPIGPPPTSHFHILADAPGGIQPVAMRKEGDDETDETGKSGKKRGKKGDKEKKLEKTDDEKRNLSLASKNSEDFREKDVREIYRKASDEVSGSGDQVMPDIDNFGLTVDQYERASHSLPHSNIPKSKAMTSTCNKPWSEQETLLLLEGMELFRDDWNRVSEHVGSRDQNECILHFMRLPIEDPYYEGKNIDLKKSGPKYLQQHQPVPFSSSGNPVMSTVAFLASMVDPKVAAAASKAAIKEFGKMKNELPKEVVDAHVKVVKQEFERSGKLLPETGLEEADLLSSKVKSETNNDQDLGEDDMDTEDINKKNKVSEKKLGEKSRENSGEKINDKSSEKSVGKHNESKNSPLSEKPTDQEVESAAAAALSAAAVKSKYLAQMEERKIQGLVALLVETQLKKVELKLKAFEDLEKTIEAEREHLEIQREQLVMEKQNFHMEQIKAHEARNKALHAEQQRIAQQRNQLNMQQQQFAMQRQEQARREQAHSAPSGPGGSSGPSSQVSAGQSGAQVGIPPVQPGVSSQNGVVHIQPSGPVQPQIPPMNVPNVPISSAKLGLSGQGPMHPNQIPVSGVNTPRHGSSEPASPGMNQPMAANAMEVDEDTNQSAQSVQSGSSTFKQMADMTVKSEIRTSSNEKMMDPMQISTASIPISQSSSIPTQNAVPNSNPVASNTPAAITSQNPPITSASSQNPVVPPTTQQQPPSQPPQS